MSIFATLCVSIIEYLFNKTEVLDTLVLIIINSNATNKSSLA